MRLVLLMISLGCPRLVLGKCIEWEISCDGKVTFFVGTITTSFSDGQKLSSSEQSEISTGCACAESSSSLSSCTAQTGGHTITLSCSKRETSDNNVEDSIAEEEETLLEESVIAATAILALASITAPPLPLFPPQGLPQPLNLQGGIAQATGGGILPTVALTVSNQNFMHDVFD